MKLVINTCYGGFSLSALAVKRMAELKGRECYFYANDIRTGVYTPIRLEEADRQFCFHAFDIPNIGEVVGDSSTERWAAMTLKERKAHNALLTKHDLDHRPDDRADPILVQVVEELGEKADGSHAELKVVEIPDGVKWEIQEYDGLEHVAEVHRTWA